MMIKVLTTFTALALCLAAPAALADGTHVQLQSLPSYVHRIYVPVVPQTENSVTIEALPLQSIEVTPPGFEVRIVSDRLVVFADRAEESGYAVVRAGGRELTLTLASVKPYEAVRDGKLDGYAIGSYSERPLRGLESYERPDGFVRLTPKNGELFVSDHYRLRDFQCKLDGASKFLVLRTEALLKLEILQHELESRHGVQLSRFSILSGYRTPYYNARIGNETTNSRHLYGDAMDIYVDANGDGTMDDINRDGRTNAGDARFLLEVAESIDRSPEWGWLRGGAGVYEANAAHGPYLHVDARGYVARWGALAGSPPATRAMAVPTR
ncbi:MAG TPA: D-Ala-D-Ala carboxypeptidase family metallohydrolase [Thermoanaerobaculia bacterium]|jgi:hypothetical protein